MKQIKYNTGSSGLSQQQQQQRHQNLNYAGESNTFAQGSAHQGAHGGGAAGQHGGGQQMQAATGSGQFVDHKYSTLKIKNAGLRKYQRQFQSSQPTSQSSQAHHQSHSNPPQPIVSMTSGGITPKQFSQQHQQHQQQHAPTKLIIQSQHGRTIKRQQLGSGGIQVRGPQVFLQHQQPGGAVQKTPSQSNLHNQQQMQNHGQPVHMGQNSMHPQQQQLLQQQQQMMSLKSKAFQLQSNQGHHLMLQNNAMNPSQSIKEGASDVVGLKRVPLLHHSLPQQHQQQQQQHPPGLAANSHLSGASQHQQQQPHTVIAVRQNRLNKLQKHQNIQNVGGDQMSENGSNSVGVDHDQDEDVPETLSDERKGMYHQMNGKGVVEVEGKQQVVSRPMGSGRKGQGLDQTKMKLILKPDSQSQLRSRFLSPTNNVKPDDLEADHAALSKAIYHSPQDPLPAKKTHYKVFESQNKNEEDHDLLKSECESMHKLIKELNEQAMDMLYSSNQKNVSLEGGPGSAQEYLVIQRKLSEIKQSALQEPDGRSKGLKDDELECSDLQKSLRTLEKALKILTIQHQKQRILVKPIYISIITYNIACCHQQTNNLKKCDKLLSQSIQLLEEDIEIIDKILAEFESRAAEITTANTAKKRKLQKLEDRIRFGRKPQGQEFEARRRGQLGCWICSHLNEADDKSSTTHIKKCLFEDNINQAYDTFIQEPVIIPCSMLYLKYTRMRQHTILLLQHCAILSQLNRHGDALSYAHSTTKILHKVSCLAIKIVQGKTNNLIEMDKVEEDRERVEQAVDEFYKLHKWLKSAAGDAHSNALSQTPDDKLKQQYNSTDVAQSVHGVTTQKKERRGRGGRKPSVQVNSAQKLQSTLNNDQSSLRKGKKNSTSGLYTPLQTDGKKGEKFPRSRSQHSRRSYSKYSENSFGVKSRSGSVARSRSSQSVISACLSNISKKQKKNIKQINAGLERLHTFGMSSVHKGILEVQEQKKLHQQKDALENDEDRAEGNNANGGGNSPNGKKKTISKTISYNFNQQQQASMKKAQGQTDENNTNGEDSAQNGNSAMKKKQSVTPLTSLKFLNPKEIQANDAFDDLSKMSSEQSNDVTPTAIDAQLAQQRKLMAQSVSSTIDIEVVTGQSFLRPADDEANGKSLCQSVKIDKDDTKVEELQVDQLEQSDDLKLPEVISDRNSNSISRDKSKVQSKSKFSYYVRDQFQPLQKQKENIEKLLRQFSDHQKDFLDIIFQNQFTPDINSSEGGGLEHLRGYDSGASGSLPLNLVQKQTSFSSLVIKNLKLSFQSIEEIERLKRDYNMYRQTQRNQLGISKPTKLSGEFGSRRSNRLNWIDLFNIGNVMLMRGQDIQMSHRGWNEVCEYDNLDLIMQQEKPKPPQMAPNGKVSRPSSLNKASFKNKLNNRDSRNMESTSSQGSNLQPKDFDSNRISNYESLDDMPELSLLRCNRYSISKDSFTEIVLLTVISYFCVSTEHRFINMNQDREKQQQKQQQATNDNAAGASMFDLNNSNQSMPSTIRSAGIQGGSGLNSTLQRSTKDRTQTSSTQRQLAARNQKNLDGNKSMQNTNFQSSNFNSNSSSGNQKHIQSLQEKGTGLKVNQSSNENNTAMMLSNIENQGSTSERYSQVDHQEYFLCKALHFGLLYLPPDSPLVQHLTQNYIKNYLQPRLQKREDLVNKFMQ